MTLYATSGYTSFLTFINKHQGELVFGTAVPQLRRVGSLVLPGERIKQDLHQTFGPVQVDLAVLQRERKREKERQGEKKIRPNMLTRIRAPISSYTER